jgi:DNA polymerase-3 subunit alpha (Gram-positive type)
MALRVAYFKVHHPLYYYCAYFSIRAKAFDLATMSGGLDKVKSKMEEIALKRRTTKLQTLNRIFIPHLNWSMKCWNVVSSLVN